MATWPRASADAPAPAHGETEDNPSPVPRARRMSESAAATNAPAMTAPHDTPDAAASLGSDTLSRGRCGANEDGTDDSICTSRGCRLQKQHPCPSRCYQ